MTHHHGPRWAYLYVNLATLFWAGNMVTGRALTGQIGPYTLTAARVAIAGLLLFVATRRLPASDRRVGRDWPLMLAMTFAGIIGFPVLLYYALQFTTATNASLINGTGPLITAALAALLLKDRLRVGQLAGLAVSLVGVMLVIGLFDPRIQLSSINRGDVIMLLCAALWGLYSVVGRVVMRGRSSLSVTAFATWFAVPPLAVAAVLEWRTSPPVLSVPLGLGVLYISVFAAFLGVILWNEGVRVVGPTGAMAFYNMLPVFGALLGAIFLGERLAPLQLAGAVLVVFGGLVSALWKSSLGHILSRRSEIDYD